MSSFKQLSSRLVESCQWLHKDSTVPSAPFSQDYLTGLRGILVVQSLVWLYLQTFVPTVVSHAASGPLYRTVIRDVLSVPFWNGTLISSFFIILSARTLCVPFLSDPTVATFSRSLIGRPLRVGISLAIATAIAIAIVSTLGASYVQEAAEQLDNPLIPIPTAPKTHLAAFNAIYDILWIVRTWSLQAANLFWPSATLWAPSLIYSQSYTVYAAMVILPFTRPSWHLGGLSIFILGSYWQESWGWYSATGLLIADISLSPTLKSRFLNGIKISADATCPSWIPAAVLVIVGGILKYMWTLFPQYVNEELILHPVLHLSDYTSVATWDTTQPYARLDDFLVVVGVLLLIEYFPRVQTLLSSKALTFLGKRSLSIFVAQSLIIYTAGLKLFLHLHVQRRLPIAAANVVVAIVCLPAVFLAAEIFHRLVDVPSRSFGRFFYTWLRE